MGAPRGNKNASGKHTIGLTKRQKKQVKKFHSGDRRQRSLRNKKMKKFYGE
jgi:hypothetical protein